MTLRPDRPLATLSAVLAIVVGALYGLDGSAAVWAPLLVLAVVVLVIAARRSRDA